MPKFGSIDRYSPVAKLTAERDAALAEVKRLRSERDRLRDAIRAHRVSTETAPPDATFNPIDEELWATIEEGVKA